MSVDLELLLEDAQRAVALAIEFCGKAVVVKNEGLSRAGGLSQECSPAWAQGGV